VQQQAKDTAVITNLMKGIFKRKLAQLKDKIRHMRNHILNHISVLIARDGKTLVTLKKTETILTA
jgi:hypothetical protein